MGHIGKAAFDLFVRYKESQAAVFNINDNFIAFLYGGNWAAGSCLRADMSDARASGGTGESSETVSSFV